MGGGKGEFTLKLNVRFKNALPTSFPRAIEGATSNQKVSACFRLQDAAGEEAGAHLHAAQPSPAGSLWSMTGIQLPPKSSPIGA